jgi:hypothetical protein
MNSKCIVCLTASAITYLLHCVSLPAAQAYLRKMPPQAPKLHPLTLKSEVRGSELGGGPV